MFHWSTLRMIFFWVAAAAVAAVSVVVIHAIICFSGIRESATTDSFAQFRSCHLLPKLLFSLHMQSIQNSTNECEMMIWILSESSDTFVKCNSYWTNIVFMSNSNSRTKIHFSSNILFCKLITNQRIMCTVECFIYKSLQNVFRVEICLQYLPVIQMQPHCYLLFSHDCTFSSVFKSFLCLFTLICTTVFFFFKKNLLHKIFEVVNVL